MARAELTDIPGRDPPGGSELAKLAATLEVEAEQAGPALRATIRLDHHGDAPVSLIDPFDMVRLQLRDEDGAPLELARHVPAVYRHTPPATVTIEPDDQIETSVQIDRLADGRPLASGTYAVGAMATLIDADDTHRSRIVRSNPLPVRLSGGGD